MISICAAMFVLLDAGNAMPEYYLHGKYIQYRHHQYLINHPIFLYRSW